MVGLTRWNWRSFAADSRKLKSRTILIHSRWVNQLTLIDAEEKIAQSMMAGSEDRSGESAGEVEFSPTQKFVQRLHDDNVGSDESGESVVDFEALDQSEDRESIEESGAGGLMDLEVAELEVEGSEDASSGEGLFVGAPVKYEERQDSIWDL